MLPETLLNKGDSLRCTAIVEGKPGAVTLRGEAEDFVVAKRRTDGSDEMWKQTLENWAVMGKALAVCVIVLGRSHWRPYGLAVSGPDCNIDQKFACRRRVVNMPSGTPTATPA